jgi:hypothetical protein
MALKENGILIVNTPSNLGGSDVHSKGEESFIEEHCRDGYSVDEIRNKLESAGLSIEEIVYTYGTYGNIAWKLGIKYPMQMLNKSKFFVLIIPFYYILTILFTFLLMRVDYSKKNTSGTGLLVIAKKRA